MADLLLAILDGSVSKRLKDMGDGTYAEVVSVSGASGGGGGGSGDASASNQLVGNASLANIDADIGAQADAAWSGTGNSTVIAALKAIWTALKSTITIYGQRPVRSNNTLPRLAPRCTPPARC